MAAMFTVKDLEVYKDSLKEKKTKPTKTADKPPLRTPPSVTKLSKPPLKLNNEESLKERKPLSVVHKTSNTIKDSHPIGSSKQADQFRRSKEATAKSLPAGKKHTTEVNSLVKSSDYRSDLLKSPKEPLPLKPSHIKSDDNKTPGVRKQSTHASPVYQKSPSLSGAKAPSTVDLNASLCSECARSASEGAVCFIGNDGRVSACTTRAAVRLCKNLNCAANNPEYVAAMANAPKKYLISKRHLLKAQFGPKSRSIRPKSPNVLQSDSVEHDETRPSSEAASPSVEELSPSNADGIAKSSSVESDDVDLSLLGDDASLFEDEVSLLNGNLSIEKDVIGSTSADATGGLDVAVGEHRDFSFHDQEAAEPESPKFLVVDSCKDLTETHSTGGIESSNEDAESLAIENFEEPDDEDLDSSPKHRESKAEELCINYGDLMPSEEADGEDASGNAAELTQKDIEFTQTDIPLSIDEGENGSREGNQTSARLPTSDHDQDGGSNQEITLSPTAGIDQVVDNSCGDESIPVLDSEQLVEDISGGCFDAVQLADNTKDDDLATLNATEMEHGNLISSDADSGDPVLLSVADDQWGDHLSLHEVDDDLSGVTTFVGVTTLTNGKQVDSHEGDIKSLHSVDNDQSNDDVSYVDNTHEEYEDESDEDVSEDEEPDEKLRGSFTTEENQCIDAQDRKEETLNETVAKDQDNGTVSSNSTRRPRRRRVLRGVEEVSPETVILRKQQMLERKQAEEWMLNHAIEGVVHKLAPTGEAKVKILVEAFEAIISHTDVEFIDSHNTRQEKRITA